MIALLAGILFGAGLAVSGMMQPEKVIGFLDITGNWDASLMLVMGGALAVFTPGYIGRFSVRSLIATGLFMFSGMPVVAFVH